MVNATLENLFNPKSIVIIGASGDKKKASYTVWKNLVEDFKGKIYLVNPKYKEIEGIRCYKSVRDIRKPIDLGVVIVNASISNSVIKEAMESKVRFLVVITSGYREIGKEGIKREIELKEMLKKYNYKTRIVGPNCLGILDNFSRVNILFLPKEKLAKPLLGSISLIFQSGALGAAVIDRLSSEGIGIGRFVSYGNAVDLNELDFLEYFLEDRKTKVIGIYLEGIRNGKRLFELLKKSKKPIIMVKGGKTRKGSKATLTHTGSIAGNYDIFKGVCQQTNTILADNFRDFENYLKIFDQNPLMKTNKIMVLTNGGGFGVLSSDEVESSEVLDLYTLNKKEEKLLREILPDYGNISNPLDLLGDATPERYEKALKILNNDEIGAYMVVILPQTFSMDERIVEVLSKIKRAYRKPIVCVLDGGGYVFTLRTLLESKGITSYGSVHEAVKSLEKLYWYSERTGLDEKRD